MMKLKLRHFIHLLFWRTSLPFVLHGRFSQNVQCTITKRQTHPRAHTTIQTFKPLPTHQDYLTELEQQNNKTVVIVGAGVGGLAVASRLASSLSKIRQENGYRSNTRVVVLEKNGEEWNGGRCGSFNIDVDGFGSFRHERGPSLLLLKDEYLKLFTDCLDKRAEDYGLDMVPCAPAYQVVFDDGDRIHLGFPKIMENQSYVNSTLISILQERSRQRMNDLEDNGFAKWEEYLRITDAYLNCGLPNFIEQKLDLSSFPAFLHESFRDGAKVRRIQ